MRTTLLTPAIFLLTLFKALGFPFVAVVVVVVFCVVKIRVVLPQLKGACQQELTTACTSDCMLGAVGLRLDLRSLFKNESLRWQ